MANFYPAPEPRQAYPKLLPVTQGAQPRPAGPLGGSAVALSAIGVWSALAAVPMPIQKPLTVAPVTLVYGQQPPRIDPMPKVQAQVVRASWPEANEPRLQFNDQQPERRYIVPLTLVYGSQPPLVGPLSVVETNIAVRSWDAARQEPPALIGSAAWNIPAVAPAFVPFVRQGQPAALIDWGAQKSTSIVPLTFTYGDQPLSDAKRVARHLAWRAWDVLFVQPPQPIGTAAWNVPPIIVSGVPFTPLPGSILASWQIDWRAQSAGKIAPLTLVYGQQPPSQGALIVPQITAILAPAPTWGAQSEPDNAHWNVPIIIAQVPFFRSPIPYAAIDWSAQRGSQVAPLTLTYGQQPPINGSITPTELNQILRAWDVTWSAQSPSPNAPWSGLVVVLSRAIAQSDGSIILTAGLSASITVAQNTGIILIQATDSKTIALGTTQNATVSLETSD